MRGTKLYKGFVLPRSLVLPPFLLSQSAGWPSPKAPGLGPETKDFYISINIINLLFEGGLLCVRK